MHLRAITLGLMMGCLAFALSRFPNVLRGLIEGIWTLSDQFDSRPNWSRSEPDVSPIQAALGMTGAALVLLSVYALAARV